MVNQIAKYSAFATFDLKSAYYQVEISPEDRIYTAFEANRRLYEFKHIPTGITNGVPKFQRATGKVVKVEDLEGAFPYMDNVTVCGINQKDHDENVARFRDTAKKYSLTLNESKTVSSITAINILGYCVSHSLIKPDPHQLQASMELPPPLSPKSLQCTIGLFGYYSKFITGSTSFHTKLNHCLIVKCFPQKEKPGQPLRN